MAWSRSTGSTCSAATGCEAPRWVGEDSSGDLIIIPETRGLPDVSLNLEGSQITVTVAGRVTGVTAVVLSYEVPAEGCRDHVLVETYHPHALSQLQHSPTISQGADGEVLVSWVKPIMTGLPAAFTHRTAAGHGEFAAVWQSAQGIVFQRVRGGANECPPVENNRVDCKKAIPLRVSGPADQRWDVMFMQADWSGPSPMSCGKPNEGGFDGAVSEKLFVRALLKDIILGAYWAGNSVFRQHFDSLNWYYSPAISAVCREKGEKMAGEGHDAPWRMDPETAPTGL